MSFQPFAFNPNGEAGEGNILTKMKHFYDDTVSIQTTLWNEGDIDQRFKMGDQSLWSRIYAMYPMMTNRSSFNFNYIRKYINYICGWQRQHRKASICIPQEDGDQITADEYTKCLLYTSRLDKDLDTISDCFEHACTTGVGYLHTWLDYRHDPVNGTIRTSSLPYNMVMLDPYYRDYKKQSDCNFMWMRRYVSKEEARELYRSKTYEIDQLHQHAYRDEKFIFLQEQFSIRKRTLFALDIFQYLDSREAIFVIDPETGETMEYKGDDKDEDFRYRVWKEDLVVKKIKIPTVRCAHVLNNQLVLYDGLNPLGVDRYSIIPTYCYFEPDSTIYSLKVQGFVRQLRDVQYLYNHRKRLELDQLEATQTGLKIMQDSLVDDSAAYNTGNGRMLWIKKNAPLGLGSVEPMPGAEVSQSAILLSQSLTQDMEQIIGISDESMGMKIDDKAAVITMMRQQASQVGLQKVFDNLDVAQANHAELKLDIILNNFGPGKIRNILQKEPSEFFFNKVFEKYHVQITNGYDTATQKQMTARQLFELQQLGYPIPVEYMLETVDIQDKQGLIQAIKQQQEAQAQQAQQMQQLQQMQLQAEMQAMGAKAKSDEALAAERISRVGENESLAIERQANAQEARDRGVLDKIKAVKEIQSIELQQLADSLNILSALEGEQKEQEEMGARDVHSSLAK